MGIKLPATVSPLDAARLLVAARGAGLPATAIAQLEAAAVRATLSELVQLAGLELTAPACPPACPHCGERLVAPSRKVN
jgi:hypothetical protein